jgi:hypothetical protein
VGRWRRRIMSLDNIDYEMRQLRSELQDLVNQTKRDFEYELDSVRRSLRSDIADLERRVSNTEDDVRDLDRRLDRRD